MLWVVSAGLLVAGAVGCGNKGPLVLPAKPPAADAAPAVPVQPAALDSVDLEAEVQADTDAGSDVDADADADATTGDDPAAAKPGV